MAFDKAPPIRTAPATYARVTAIKQEMEREKQRQVTYDEVLGELVKLWDTTGALMADVRKATP